MAIINVTPDSFSDGGRFINHTNLLRHAEAQIKAGATILDVGGESTRPGAETVPVDEELKRVLPAIQALRDAFPEITLSIDTRKAKVAKAALEAGAQWVNDVSCLRYDEAAMLETVVRHEAHLVLNHSIAEPKTMQQHPHYPDGVVSTVISSLLATAQRCEQAGVPAEKIILDPGFGFAKTVAHNLELLRHLNQLVALGYPVLAGLSRKSFLTMGEASITPDKRELQTALAHVEAYRKGVRLFRVHDCVLHAPAFRFIEALHSE